MKKLTIAVNNCGLLHSRNICQKLTIRKIRKNIVKKMRITKISVKVVYVARR